MASDTGRPAIKLDTSDPGKAADVFARAAILFARTSGFVADNEMRARQDYMPAYDSAMFEEAVEECFPELLAEREKAKGGER